MPSATFSVGDITAVIGDNGADGEHRAGYNGVWSLVHKTEPTNLFVPIVAGLNLEHVYDGHTLDADNSGNIFFEPRRAPMTFKKIADDECELHQPPTPTFKFESWTRFKLVAPHYIDMTFRGRATQHVFRHGYIGLFWASYMNAPEDKSLYLLSRTGWQQFCTPAHNNQSTVLHADDKFELTFSPGHRDCLYKNFSPLRYDKPFYYGLYRNMTFLLMFDKSEGIRLSHSPSGGGFNKALNAANPAWDFQFVIPKYEVNTDYGFRARAVYRPRCSREEVVKEFDGWRAGLK